MSPGQVGRPLEEVTDEDWHAVLDANLTTAFLCTRAAVPGMKERRWGRIIMIASTAGLGVSKTGIQAYTSAKAAQIGFTRQMAHDLGPFGITVNCIAPGFIRSNPATEKQWASYGPDGQAALVEGISMRRLGQPADIANGVQFFASERSSWVTGQISGHRRRPCLPAGGGAGRDGGRRHRDGGLPGDGYLAELAALVAIPSVSRDAAPDTMGAAAQWIAGQLGFAAGRVDATGGHPVVRGEWLGAAGAPTVLVYGHYDVQPTGDPAEWRLRRSS